MRGADQKSAINTSPQQTQQNNGSSPITIPNKYSSYTQTKINPYSEFASWNQVNNEHPYW